MQWNGRVVIHRARRRAGDGEVFSILRGGPPIERFEIFGERFKGKLLPKVFRKTADQGPMKKTVDFQPEGRFHCSELITLSTGRQNFVGNLEEIERSECSVLLDAPLTAGTRVRLECVDCPLRRRGQGCLKCRFAGEVESQEENAHLGRLTKISFQGRLWSRGEWRPRHLTDLSRVGAASRSD